VQDGTAHPNHWCTNIFSDMALLECQVKSCHLVFSVLMVIVCSCRTEPRWPRVANAQLTMCFGINSIRCDIPLWNLQVHRKLSVNTLNGLDPRSLYPQPFFAMDPTFRQRPED